MKNQYFGDNRDLFTYDLIYHVMKSGLVEHLTFIPMLTENDDKPHGQKVDRKLAKAGTKNKELIAFLDDCVKNEKRDIKQLESYFIKNGIKMTLYARDKYFTHSGRKEYFVQIGDELPGKSLVFLDPDIGLEVKHPGKEHVLFSEVKDLYQRMDKSSILMIFQYLPRLPHLEYLNMRCEEIKDRVMGDHPICIDDNQMRLDIALYIVCQFLCKSTSPLFTSQIYF